MHRPISGTRVVLIVGATLLMSGLSAAEPPPDIEAHVGEAIESLRGVDVWWLFQEGPTRLDEVQAAAIETLREQPASAEREILRLLAEEQDDDFRTIDLVWILLGLQSLGDRFDFSPTLDPLADVDPNAFPVRFYQVVSTMSSSGCERCLPVVLKMLELSDLHSPTPRLPSFVVSYGLMFTVGSYGERAVPPVAAMLEHPDCGSRANAAWALALLLPDREPPKLREMALADPCQRARTMAWSAIGALDEPGLAALAAKALRTEPGPSIEVRLAITAALRQSFSPEALVPLTVLVNDPDESVASTVAAVASELLEYAPEPRELWQQVGSGPPALGERVRRALEQAVVEHRFDARTEAGVERDRLGEILRSTDDPEEVERVGDQLVRLMEQDLLLGFHELLQALKPADLPRLQAARSAVLRRLSDESLSEYYQLTQLARALRSVRREPLTLEWKPGPVLEEALASARAAEQEEEQQLAVPEACRNELRLFGPDSRQYRECVVQATQNEER